MRRSVGIWVVSVLLVLPLLWLWWTTQFETTRDVVLLTGGAATAAMVLYATWNGHLRGRILPHRCRTCEHPMARITPGELRPPQTDGPPQAEPRWRCRACGRMV